MLEKIRSIRQVSFSMYEYNLHKYTIVGITCDRPHQTHAVNGVEGSEPFQHWLSI